MKVNINKKKIVSLATAGIILISSTGIILDKSNIPEDYNIISFNLEKEYDYTNLSKEYTPQGYTISNNSIFISAYHNKKELNSKIFMIDKNNNINTIILDNKDHVGGLSIDEYNNILFVTSSNGKISTYDLNKIYKELSNSKDNTVVINTDMKIDNDINNYTHSVSSICINNNKLYTTTYGEKCILKEYNYKLIDNEIKAVLLNTQELDIPCVQGIDIYNNYLLLSSSSCILAGNIKIPSKITIYDLNDFSIKNISYIKQGGLEGINIDNNGNITGIFELEDQKIKNIGNIQTIINDEDSKLLELNEDKFNIIYDIMGNRWDKRIENSNKKIKL